MLGPELGAEKTTGTSGTGLPWASNTLTAIFFVNCVLMGPLCGLPKAIVILAGTLVVLVRVSCWLGSEPLVAVTVNDPAIELAVRVALATPLASVTAEIMVTPPANMPLAPLLPAMILRVTAMPGNGLKFESSTVAVTG